MMRFEAPSAPSTANQIPEMRPMILCLSSEAPALGATFSRRALHIPSQRGTGRPPQICSVQHPVHEGQRGLTRPTLNVTDNEATAPQSASSAPASSPGQPWPTTATQAVRAAAEVIDMRQRYACAPDLGERSIIWFEKNRIEVSSSACRGSSAPDDQCGRRAWKKTLEASVSARHMREANGLVPGEIGLNL